MAGIRTHLARLKRKITQKPYLKDMTSYGYWFDQVLGVGPAFVVQIGSNDGKTGDPLYPLLKKHDQWKGLFVEPVPSSFAKLKLNYPDASRFTLENVAINHGEQMTFYYVDPIAKEKIPKLPFWYDQLGSFNREHITQHLDGILTPFIRSKEITGLSLAALFARNRVENIDILHIDTEGYDWQILQQLDLAQYQPRFIIYEFKHLAAADYSATLQFLQPQYTTFNMGIDILAVHQSLGERTINAMAQKLQLAQ